jgi:hypothetical protein
MTRLKSVEEMPAGLHVQFGCHHVAPLTWRNFDASPTLRFERLPVVGGLYSKNEDRFPRNVEYGDIVRGLPVPENSCSGLYASHVLEHLALDDFRVAVRKSLALLKPGGIFRLVVPDLGVYARRYIETQDAEAAERFMRQTCLGVESRPRNLKALLFSWLGNSSHLWMWDQKSLVKELTDAGFVSIRRCAFGDCEDRLFSHVEQRDRFVDAVAIECRRPGPPFGTD